MNVEKARSNGWTEQEDMVLTKIVCTFVGEGHTQLDAFDKAAYRIERTAAACGYRWNATLRNLEPYKSMFQKAKSEAIEERNNLRYKKRLEKHQREGFFFEQDPRYTIPKEEPRADEDSVTEAIKGNDIYSTVLELMTKAQRKQVAYGLDKYVETLNPHSWSTVETINHIIEENVDQLHYLVMLKLKLLEEMGGE